MAGPDIVTAPVTVEVNTINAPISLGGTPGIQGPAGAAGADGAQGATGTLIALYFGSEATRDAYFTAYPAEKINNLLIVIDTAIDPDALLDENGDPLLDENGDPLLF